MAIFPENVYKAMHDSTLQFSQELGPRTALQIVFLAATLMVVANYVRMRRAGNARRARLVEDVSLLPPQMTPSGGRAARRVAPKLLNEPAALDVRPFPVFGEGRGGHACSPRRLETPLQMHDPSSPGACPAVNPGQFLLSQLR